MAHATPPPPRRTFAAVEKELHFRSSPTLDAGRCPTPFELREGVQVAQTTLAGREASAGRGRRRLYGTRGRATASRTAAPCAPCAARPSCAGPGGRRG